MAEKNKESLEKSVQELAKEKKTLQRKIDLLNPKVLGHFNSYVREVINPLINPEGYALRDSDSCYFEEVSFNLVTGEVETFPDKERLSYYPPIEVIDAIFDFTRKYVKQTPWVSRVNLGFPLPK